MKYIIVNEVRSIKYFWNQDKERWEGLEDNATKYQSLKEVETIKIKINQTQNKLIYHEIFKNSK